MKRLIMGLLVGTFLLVGCAGIALGEDPKVLRWALIPAEEAALELELWTPIGDYLEEELGIKQEMIICDDYTAVIQALKFNHADIGRFGTFNYVLATTQLKMEPLVRAIRKSTGKDAYYSLIVTYRYSDIQTLEDLRGRTFAFTDPASTSGSLVPKTMLIKAGIDPESDLGETFYTHSHEASMLAVQKQKVDAAAIASNRLADAIERGTIKEWELVIIARSDAICGGPIAIREGFSEDLKERFRQAFFTMPRELALTSGLKALGYVIAKDEDYDPIREIAKTLELDLTKKK